MGNETFDTFLELMRLFHKFKEQNIHNQLLSGNNINHLEETLREVSAGLVDQLSRR